MSLLELLDQSLKSDKLIDLLEANDAEVTYDFDRCHENLPDSYSTQIADLGLELTFDEHQKLQTIFITVADVDVTEAFDGEITPFASIGKAVAFAEQQGLPFRQGRSELFGIPRVWIRIQHSSYFAHYEYQPDQLAKISLTARDVYASP
ncbi:hypothetical protein BH09VER1_BH09VER1_12700 [soil metagenome]